MARSREENTSGCCRFCMKCGEALVITLDVLAIIVNLILIAFGSVILAAEAILASYIPFQQSFSGFEINLQPLIDAVQTGFLNPIGIAFVVVGAVFLGFSIVGCVAAIKRQFCLMIIYCIFLGIISIALIATVIIFSQLQASLFGQISTMWQSMVSQSYVDIPVFQNTTGLGLMPLTIGVSTNLVMNDWSCCGINSYTDMQSSPYWNQTYVFNVNNSSSTCSNAKIPPVCCQGISALANSYNTTTVNTICNCIQNPTPQNSFMNNVCFNKFMSWSFIGTYNSVVYPIIIGIWAGFGGLIFIFFVYTIYLSVMYRRRNKARHNRDYDDGVRTQIADDRNKYDRTIPMGEQANAGNTNLAYLPNDASAPPPYK